MQFMVGAAPCVHSGEVCGIMTGLSVSITQKVSSTATASPGCLSHSMTVPSVMLSPMDGTAKSALAAAELAKVRGREVTPFLLAALAEASGGDVVRTNVALVESNARLAAEIAVADVRADDDATT